MTNATASGGIIQKKPVDAWKDGHIVGTYESISDAARQLKIGKTSIGRCLSGEASSRKGYQFTIHESSTPKAIPLPISPASDASEGTTSCTSPLASPVPVEAWKGSVFIGVYKSMSAAGRAFGINPGNISNVVRGRQTSANGYVFKIASGDHPTKDAPIAVPFPPSKARQDAYNRRPVEAYKDGVLIGAFPSISGAAKALGTNTNSISRVADGLSPSIKGMTFKYASKHIRPKKFPTEIWEGDALKGTYNTQEEAAASIGISGGLLSSIVRGVRVNTTPYTFKRIQTPAGPTESPEPPSEAEAAETPAPAPMPEPAAEAPASPEPEAAQEEKERPVLFSTHKQMRGYIEEIIEFLPDEERSWEAGNLQAALDWYEDTIKFFMDNDSTQKRIITLLGRIDSLSETIFGSCANPGELEELSLRICEVEKTCKKMEQFMSGVAALSENHDAKE